MLVLVYAFLVMFALLIIVVDASIIYCGVKYGFDEDDFFMGIGGTVCCGFMIGILYSVAMALI